MNSHRGVGRRGGGVRGGGKGGGVREDDMSPVGEKGGNMFELFRTYDEEEEYTVYVREDGKRFYVDWEEQVGVVVVMLLLDLFVCIPVYNSP